MTINQLQGKLGCRLIEEDFYRLFAQELRKSVEKLPARKKPEQWAMTAYLREWHAFNQASDPDDCVVSCDGSIAESVFSGGLEAWVGRAVAHIRPKQGSMTSLPSVEVPVGYELGGKSIFLKTIELETLSRAIERATENHAKVFAVYDGNLSLFLPARYLQRLQPLADLFERHVKAIIKCFKLTQQGRVELVGVSKDSNVTYLRARLTLDALLQADPEVGEAMRRGQRSLRLMARRLTEIIEHDGKSSLRPYLNELGQPISDEALYGELDTGPGYTAPLLLAPQTRFFALEAEKGTNDWWDSSFRRLLERNSALEGLRVALDDLYSLPPVAISYWKPRHGPATFRIDIPSNLLGQESKTGDMKENVLAEDIGSDRTQGLVSKLNWLSQGENIVSPLTEVDAIARLDRRLYHSSYEPLIIKELASKGHTVRLSKRRIRDYVLRGY